MHPPVNTEPTIGEPAVSVHIEQGAKAVSHSEMKERARWDYLAEHEAPSVLRLVPLFRILDVGGRRGIAVGSVRIVVSGTQQVALEVFVHDLWTERKEQNHFIPLDADGPEHHEAITAANNALRRNLADSVRPVTDDREVSNEYHAALIAKNLAEVSRNSTADVREIRYRLETTLARTSREASAHGSQTSVVSALLQLGIILGRGADTAREAVREGLWVFITDSEAYHSYRALQDPTRLNGAAPATADTRPWMRLHDAAMRHCEEMHRQLDAESVCVHAILAAAASVSSAREADAQSSFNTLAAVASLGLGIPALVLALYGTDRLLPLDTLPRQIAFLPVAAGLVFAAFLAIRQSPRGKHRWTWLAGAAAALLALLGLLVVAGLIAPTT